MLLLTGGLIFWKVTSDDEPKPAPPPPVTTTTAPRVFEEPPPPPPPPPPPQEETPDAGTPEKQPVKRPSGGGGCAGDCTGQATSQLQAQLRARGAQARPCYERALRQNDHLQGRMQINLRIGPNGNVCSANVGLNEIGDTGVATCVLQMFRSSTFPAPQGGCVDVVVPLRFEPKS